MGNMWVQMYEKMGNGVKEEWCYQPNNCRHACCKTVVSRIEQMLNFTALINFI